MGTARQYLELIIIIYIVLIIEFKSLFSSYDVICLPRTLLWHVPDFPDDQSARSGSPCIYILESIYTTATAADSETTQ